MHQGDLLVEPIGVLMQREGMSDDDVGRPVRPEIDAAADHQGRCRTALVELPIHEADSAGGDGRAAIARAALG